jgi:DNA-binding transcriptional ArsR family regulator
MAAEVPTEQYFDHLADLSDLVLDPETPFSDRLAAALELESEHLDLPYGFLSYIDREGGQQRIVLDHGTEGIAVADKTIPLSETYCRKTIATEEGRLTVDDALEEGWADDPAYERLGLGSYVGSAVEFGGDRRGTVCLASDRPREEPLDEFEVGLVTLLARWASCELAHRAGRTGIEADADRFKVFADPADEATVDRVLDLLADRTRRELLPYLASVGDPVTVSDAAAYLASANGVPGETAERIEVALVHTHVPKLANAGVVDYDEGTGELDYRPTDALERLFDRVRFVEG